MKKNINPFVVPLSCIFAPLIGPEPVIKGDHFSLGSAVFQALKPVTRTNYVQRKLLKNVAICKSIREDKQVSLKNDICCYIVQKVQQESISNFVFGEGGRLVFERLSVNFLAYLTLCFGHFYKICPQSVAMVTRYERKRFNWLLKT